MWFCTTLPTVIDPMYDVDMPPLRDTVIAIRPLAVNGGTSHLALISEIR